jgi:hypothetical protein
LKFLTLSLFVILSTYVYSAEVCNPVGESGLSTCLKDDKDEDPVSACRTAETESDLESLSNSFDPSKKPINFCNKRMLFGGDKLSAKEMKQKKKKLRRQCKKKAKAYKKAVAKELLKKFKLGQFLQAKLKSKNKIIKGSKVSSKKYDLELGFSPDDVSNMSKEEFSSHMMKKIRAQVPSIDELIKNSDPKDAFKGSIAKQESFPMSVVVGTKGGNSCVVESPDFPAEEAFSPTDCELCKNVEMQDNFSNDCSYMVSNDLSENDARKLVGAGNKTAAGSDSHCNKDMSEVKNDMSQIDKTADKLCSIAQEGLTPDFKINSSRNLYNDYTPQLAEKRGQFTQKYLYKRIKDNCGIDKDELPSWLADENAFAEKVKVSHPEYKRPGNKPGDYGPNPNATGAEREKEKEYLAKTLDYELGENKEKLEKYKAQIADIDKEMSQINEKLNGGNGTVGLQTQYNKTKKTLDKADVRFIKDQQFFISKVSQEAHLYYARKKKLQQDKHDIESRIQNVQSEMKSPKYSKANGQFNLISKLDSFYKEKDTTNNVSAFKSKWNTELFNQFKMARISGNVSKENEFGIPEDMMTPELSLALNSLIEIKSYTCELNPISTKKVKLEGVLKGALKVVTAATLPVVAVIGAGATVAVSPITTGISLFCEGCREPGSTPPILQWGNLFHLDLSPSGRRSALKGMGGFIKNYVNWGGTLKVSSSRNITKHSLDKYAKKIGKKDYGSLSESEQDDILQQVLGEIEDAKKLQCANANRDKNPIEMKQDRYDSQSEKSQSSTIQSNQ